MSASGSTIAVKLNGEEVSRLENASRERRGHIGLQNHDEGSAVQFRSVRIALLEPGRQISGFYGSWQ